MITRTNATFGVVNTEGGGTSVGLKDFIPIYMQGPILVVTRSKTWVCGHLLTGIAGSNPAGGRGCLSLVSVVCCQVEVSASGRSLVCRVLPNVVCLSVIVKPR